VTADDRTAAALERIATALEQMALDRAPDHTIPPLMDRDISPMGEPPWPTQAPNLPITPIMQPLPPVQAAPFQFTGPSASCPVHHQPWRTVPAGTSKKTGRPYDAFLACPERGCDERPRA